eukprot:472238-Pelagomonas_calceolata.AAC.9
MHTWKCAAATDAHMVVVVAVVTMFVQFEKQALEPRQQAPASQYSQQPRMLAGPQVSAAVVTCGGLCPGLNDVIQNIVYTLRDYGVPEDNILGIK